MINIPQFDKPRIISFEEFRQIEKEKTDIGYRAELKIIEYEKDRLSEFPDLVLQIEHVAQKDVMAGYDILSFDHYDKDIPNPRFIEVKAVSPWDYRFYWTRNEIEKSKISPRCEK